jgi:hypothetical protein
MYEPGLDRHEWESEMQALEAWERGSGELSPGDIAASINGYRAVFDYIVANRSMVDADITPAGEPET